MDSDADDKSKSTGGTSVLRVAGLATLQQVPARLRKVWPRKPKNPVKKKPYARNSPAMPRYKSSCWD